MNYDEEEGSGENLPELAFDDEKKEDGDRPSTPLGNGGPGLKNIQVSISLLFPC